MSSFTDIFGGSNIYPSQPTYQALSISASVTLEWPIEQAMGGALVVADIIDITASAPGLSITMPDARQASTGFSVLYNNIGAQTVSVLSQGGATLVSLVSGTVWELYLVDNSTAAGVWRVFQFGASVSVAVAAALAGAGLKAIGATLNERMVVVSQNVNYVLVDSDRATVQQWIGGVGQFTLPAPGSVGADWFATAKNSGSGNLTILPTSGNIDSGSSLVLAPGGSCMFVTDGSNFYSLFQGGTGGSGAGFSYIIINAAGSGNLVLSGAQLNQIGYRFTGALTGNRAIIVPGTAQEYWVDNETSGAFTLTVGTATQVTPITVQQGNQVILQCDGTNVLPGQSTSVSFPISVANGGTGATTAANARTNLGATTVGSSLITAASVAAAQAAISAVPTSRQIIAGAGLTGGGDLSADRTISLSASTTQGVAQRVTDNSKTSTTALTADPVLQFTGLAAGTYVVEAALSINTSAGTQGIHAVIGGTNVSAGRGTAFQWFLNDGSTVSGGTSGIFNGSAFTTNGVSQASAGPNSTMILWIKSVVTLTGAGTIELQWAQRISSATPTIIQDGSWMTYVKMA